MCDGLAAEFPQADVAVQAGTLLRRWIDEALLSAVSDRAA
jgi:hypothetical protein